MKKSLTLIYIFLMSFSAHAQLSPFPSAGLTIGSYYTGSFFGSDANLSMQYIGDTLLCGTNLHVFQQITSPGFLMLLFYNDGAVYRRSFVSPCYIGDLVYDFSLEVNDEITVFNWFPSIVTETGQYILDNGEERKYLKLSGLPPFDNPYNDQFWVDGIGDIHKGFFRNTDFEGGHEDFICAKDDTGFLIMGPSATLDCDSLTCRPAIPGFDYSCDGPTIQFVNHSLYADNYIWDFGDGNTSTEINPEHTYTANGCYTVKLTATTQCLPDLFEKNIRVPIGQPKYFSELYDNDDDKFNTLHFINPQTGWATTQRKIYKTTDGGLSWEIKYVTNNQQVPQNVHFMDENNGVVSISDFSHELELLLTNDGGETWLPFEIAGANSIKQAYMITPQTIYANGYLKDFVKTTNGGASWEVIDIPNAGSVFQLFPLSEQVIYATAATGIGPGWAPIYFAKSLDSGLTWSLIQLPVNDLAKAIFFNDEMEGWIGTKNGNILHTMNAGENWEIQYQNPEIEEIQKIQFVSPTEGWAMGRYGYLLHTTDGGQQWELQVCALSKKLFRAMEFVSNTVGFLQVQVPFYSDGELMAYQQSPTIDCGLLNVTDEETGQGFYIYPNPAHDELNIELKSFNYGQLEITIWNLQGVEVQNEIINSQRNRINLNLSAIPLGIYFIQIKNEEKILGMEKIIVQ